MTKRIAVLSGGGRNGAFQVGAMDEYFNNNGPDFDGFFGVSTGALSAAIMCQGNQRHQLTVLDFIYTQEIIGNKSIYRSPPFGFLGDVYHFLLKSSIYNPVGLRSLIKQYIDPRVYTTQFGCGVTCIEDGKYYSILSDNHGELNSAYILASASYPVFFPPVLIGGKHYIDGGVRRQTPLKDAVKYLVSLSDPKPVDGSVEPLELHIFLTSPLNAGFYTYDNPSALDLAFRSIDLLSTSIYIDDITSLLQYNSDPTKTFITAYLYVPLINYGDSLSFDPTTITKIIDAGYKCKPIILSSIEGLTNYLNSLG